MRQDQIKSFCKFNSPEEIFETIQRIIAAPHTTLTLHDRRRAIVLACYMHQMNIILNDYISSIITEEDKKAIEKIYDCVWP